jgi:hypothetical protein
MFGPPIHDITAVRYLGDHRLHLVFADGAEGDVDIATLIKFHGVFEPLSDVGQFSQVFVDPEAGTVVWPNGADLDPLVLYAAATNQSIESLLSTVSTG